MNASPLEYIPAGQGADFIKPNAWLGTTGADNDINLLVSFARQVAASIDFATKKEAALIKKDLNAYIRDGDEVVAEEFANYELVRLWLLVKKIKTQYMKLMRDNATYDCFLGESLIGGEGYVMHSKHGVYKLVDRETFSHYNFNIIRS